jgi:uncharacterized protein (TIGR02996 family)
MEMPDPIESERRRSVLDQPDADAPRLEYAQWCAEQPDEATRARADFIRTQVALTDVFGNPDDYELRQRSYSLVRKYGAVWAGGIAELVDSYDFDRGFVELVELPALRFLEIAPLLFELAPIRHLDLKNAKPVAAELFASPHLKKIRSLRMDGAGLDDSDMKALAESQQASGLRWLSLAGNRIGFEGAELLARSNNLRGLGYAWLFNNAIEPNQKYSYDNGIVVDDWMPDDGLELERRAGGRALRWLRNDARTIGDAVPDRFRIS